MRVLVLQSGFLVSIPFFGVCARETLQAENWLKAEFRRAGGMFFDRRRKAENE